MYGLRSSWPEYRYIGSTLSLDERRRDHLESGNTSKAVSKWVKRCRRSGDEPKMHVIDSVRVKSNRVWLEVVERYWIAVAFRAGFDLLNDRLDSICEEKVNSEHGDYLRELLYPHGI